MKSTFLIVALASSTLLTTNTSHAQQGDAITAGFETLDLLNDIVNPTDPSFIEGYGYSEFLVPGNLSTFDSNSTPIMDPVDRGYIEGFGYTEFADPVYPDHESAIISAINDADASCGRNCFSDERVHIINQVYFDELEKMDSILPHGPFESVDYFLLNPINDDAEVQALMLDIDAAVRSGDLNAVMPNQFPLAFPDEYAAFDAIQKLGATNSVTITSSNPLINPRSEPFGAYGGSVFYGDRVSGYDFDSFSHESNHAGERAIVGIINDHSVNGPFQDNFDSLTVEDYLTVIDAYNIIKATQLAQANSPFRCRGCNVVENLTTEYNEYVTNPHEMRAFAAEGEAGVRGYADLLRSNNNLSRLESEKIAEQILSSRVINEQREIIDQAAQTLLERGF